MRKGFIFDHGKCAGCNSCSAACVIQNGWNIRPRNIITFNSELSLPHAVMNLSMACNHCFEPLCLKGCPANAYSKDERTGAVIIDEKKCIGCRYCQWNCPYDAPKFDEKERVIGKCNLCYHDISTGGLPACSEACPTGALQFGEINRESLNPSWFPVTVKPALVLTRRNEESPLRIIPTDGFSNGRTKTAPEKQFNEWSLLIFSFLATMSVSMIVTGLVKGSYPSPLVILAILAGAAISSLFHLGKPVRAWRALANPMKSPVSREILFFILFSALAFSATIFKSPYLMILSSAAGLLLLVAIDAIYFWSGKKREVLLHSGQTFLTGLTAISFITLSLSAFIFVASVKLLFIFSNKEFFRKLTPIRFIRAGILIVIIAGIVTGSATIDLFLICLFFTGEFIDRYLFYYDFEPDNIRKLILKHINTADDEEKRS